MLTVSFGYKKTPFAAPGAVSDDALTAFSGKRILQSLEESAYANEVSISKQASKQ